MVDCPHVLYSVSIAKLDVEQVKTYGRKNSLIKLKEQIQRSVFTGSSPAGRIGYKRLATDMRSDIGNWSCLECGTTLSPWLCLSCGLIHCGRYVNQDALKHFHYYPDHAVGMDCHSYAVFCYICDDFVGVDTDDGKITSVRSSLQYFNALRVSDHSYFAPQFEPVPEADEIVEIVLSSLVGDEETEEENVNVTDTGTETAVQKVPAIKSNIPDDQESSLEEQPIKRHKIEIGQAKECHVSEKNVRGLRNLGNTCFMNAVLQSLKTVCPFNDYMCNMPELRVKQSKSSEDQLSSLPRYNTRQNRAISANANHSSPANAVLTAELRHTLRALSMPALSPFAPDSLFSVIWKLLPRFRGFQQHDAHELLRCLLDRLQSEFQSSRREKFVAGVFEGMLQSKVTCLNCATSYDKHDPFLDLSLDIASVRRSGTAPTRLSECIARFFAKEKLDSREQYMCECCQVKRPSTKQFFIQTLPNVLCLHLKRFKWTNNNRGKVDHMVEFPMTGLDMKRHLASSALLRRVDKNKSDLSTYDLASLVVHHGSGVGSGHYTAYGLQQNDIWCHFNDSCVRSCLESVVAKQKAYILFYVRRFYC